MSENFMSIKAAIYEVGLLFNQQPSDDRINAYAKALSNYTPHQIVFAFNQVILSGSAFFPSLAEILKHLRPAQENSKDLANVVVNEIIQKCIDKGRYRVPEILDEVGDLAKIVLATNRYLIMEILDSERDQLPTIRAQVRGLVEGVIAGSEHKLKTEKLERIGILLKLPENKMQGLNYSSFLPDGIA